jgi:hypothetical protein
MAVTLGATAADAAGPVYVGAELRDNTTVLPAEFVPGAIVFDLYLLTAQSPGCTSANHVFTDTKAVTAAGIYTSDPYTAVNSGVYQWVASYFDTSYQLIAPWKLPGLDRADPGHSARCPHHADRPAAGALGASANVTPQCPCGVSTPAASGSAPAAKGSPPAADAPRLPMPLPLHPLAPSRPSLTAPRRASRERRRIRP